MLNLTKPRKLLNDSTVSVGSAHVVAHGGESIGSMQKIGRLLWNKTLNLEKLVKAVLVLYTGMSQLLTYLTQS